MKVSTRIALVVAMIVCAVSMWLGAVKHVAVAAPITGPCVIITFDDVGYPGPNAALTGYILPQMKNYSYKGVGFVIGNRSEGISVGKTLADEGWEIGSHTMSHPDAPRDMNHLSSSELTYEIVYSKTFLESNIPKAKPVLSFAYPHGDGNDNTTVVSYLRTAGYWLARDAVSDIGKPWGGVASYSEPGAPIEPYIMYNANYATVVPRALSDAKSSGKNVILLSHAGDISSANFAAVLAMIRDAISRGDISGVATFKDVMTPTNVVSSPYDVVRGPDNAIYYRSYNDSASKWSNWTKVPGETPYRPAGAVFKGKLHIAIAAMEYNAIYWGSVNLTTGAFSGWTWIPGATPSAPTLASSSHHLYLVIRGTDDWIYYRSYDGSSWSGWTMVNRADQAHTETTNSPAAAVFGRKLYIAWEIITYGYWGAIDLTDLSYSGWNYIDGGFDSAPSLTCSLTDMYLVYRNSYAAPDNLVYRIWTGSTWGGAIHVESWPAYEKHRENIATNGEYNVGEYIYKDVGVGNVGTVGVGDVRLTAVGSYAAGSTVAAGNSDIGFSLIAFTSREKHRENVATNGAYDVGEYIYRDVNTDGVVSVGGRGPDVRLTAVPPYAAGSTVASGNTDIGSRLVAFASNNPSTVFYNSKLHLLLVEGGTDYWGYVSDPSGPTHPFSGWSYNYFLTVNSAYDTPGGQGWYPSGSSAYATLASGWWFGGVGKQYIFTGWSGDATGANLTSNPIVMSAPKNATANWKTQYVIMVFSGHDAPTPSAWVDKGGNFTASVTSPADTIANNTRWVCTGYSVDSAPPVVGSSYTFTNVQAPHNITFNWAAQYYLSVSTNFGTVAPSSGWYNAGANVAINATKPANQTAIWNGWTGTGNGSYTGLNNPATITMNSAISQSASWTHQFYLTVISEHGVPIGQGWYDAGTNATASLVAGIVNGTSGVRYVFTGWSGDASGTGLTSNPIIMAGPKTAIALWKTQYYLTVLTNFGTASPASGWFDQGTNLTISSTPPSSVTGERYVWNGWTGNGLGSYTGMDNPANVTMIEPFTQTAFWIHQYYLTVTSAHGTTSGEGWYIEGANATATLDVSIVNETSVKRYMFTGWSGDASGSGLASDLIFIDGPKTAVADWKTQLWIVFQEDGIPNGVSANVTVNSVSHALNYSDWFDENATLTFSYQNPVSGSNNTRYFLSSTSVDSPLTVVGSANITGYYKTQYYLSVVTSPSGIDTPTGEGWYDADANATASVDSFVDIVANNSRYRFDHWTGDVNGTTSSISILMDGSKTVTAVYVKQYYLVMAANFGSVTPSTGWFDEGLNVPISATPPTSVAGERYVWNGWTGIGNGSYTGMNSSATVTINSQINETTSWIHQYYLTVSVDWGTYGSGNATASGWHSAGSVVSLYANPNYTYSADKEKYLFEGWNGNGTISYTGLSPSATVTMNSPIAETGSYTHRYWLGMTANYGATLPTSGWKDAGEPVYISVIAPDNRSSERYLWNGWTGTGAGSYTGFALGQWIVIDEPTNQTASWTHQFYVTVISDHDAPTPSAWVNEGGNFTAQVTSPADDDGNGTRYRATGYTIDSNQTVVDGSASYTFISVQAVHNITFNWMTQHYLTVTSAYDTPSGEGWYDAGANATAALEDGVVNGTSGTRYVFTDWSGSASGGNWSASSPIFMNAPKTAVANWKTQFYLSVDSAHDTPGGEGWYDEGTNATATLGVGTVNETGVKRYVFTEWSGDASGTEWNGSNPILMNAPKTAMANWKTQFWIAFQEDGIQDGVLANVTVNSVLHALNYSDWFDENSTVVFSYQTPVAVDDGTRYALNGTSQSSPLTVSMSVNVTGFYKMQYYLAVNTSPVGVDSPVGEGWYDAGSNATVSTAQFDDIVSGSSRYRFDSWTGAAGTYSNATVLMSTPKTVTANYVTQYYLAVDTAYGTPEGEGWYDEGTDAVASLSEGLVNGLSGTRYLFTRWSDDASGTDWNASSPILMNAAKTAVANWQTQYYLTMISDFGGVFPISGWFNASTYVAVLATDPANGTDTRYVWNGWTGTGSGSYTGIGIGPNHLASLVMNEPITQTASWIQQFKLRVEYLPNDPILNGSQSGEGWYDDGSTAVIASDENVDIVANSSRYTFDYWSGAASGTNLTATLLMNAPKNVTANYKLQYYVEVFSAHDTPTPSAWVDQGGNFTASVTSPADVIANNTRWACAGYSVDAGSMVNGTSYTFTNVQASRNITFSWVQQYYLTVASAHGVPSGEGWYDSGENAAAMLDIGMVNGTSGTRYVFTGWLGDASGVNLTSNPILMTGPKTAIADWKTQYLLTVDNGGHGTTSGQGWYNASTTASFGVSPTIVDLGLPTQYVFTKWSGSSNSTSPSSSIFMDAPKTVTANWLAQYLLTVNNGGHGTTYGQGWYNASTTANFSISPTTVNGTSGTRYVFANWFGNSNSTSPSSLILMNGPKTVTASWKVQYLVTFKEQGISISAVANVTVNSTPHALNYSDWFDANANVTFSYDDLINDGQPTRYVFVSVNSTSPVIVTSPLTITATYKTQHYLTVDHLPADSVLDGNQTGQGYYDAGLNASITAEQYVDIVNGASRYRFDHWSNNASGTNKTTTVLMGSPKTATANYVKQWKIVVNQVGSGANVTATIDSSNSTLPQSFWWDDLSTHNITIQQIINDTSVSGQRYVFTQWTGGSNSTSNMIQVGISNSTTFWANYKTQYYLTVATNPDGVDNPTGNGWYDAGMNATVSTSQYNVNQNSRHRFDSWTGAFGTYSNATVLMDAPKTATANYVMQYYLTVVSAYGTPGGEGWYDEGTNATATLQESIVNGASGTRYVFTGWSGNATGTSWNASDPIFMDGSKTALAVWKTQYLVGFQRVGVPNGIAVNVSVNSVPHVLNYSEWFDESFMVQFAYDTMVSGVAGVQYVLNSTSASSPLTVVGSANVTGYYRTQYFLTVNTDPTGLNSPAGEGWYDENVAAHISVSNVTGYFFEYWYLGGLVGTPYSNNMSTTVTMNGPQTATAKFRLGNLFEVVQGTSNSIWYRSYNGNWSEWVGLPGQTPSSPAAAVYGGYLQIVVRGMGDELWWGRINITTREFMGWWPMPGGGVITSAPTLTASDAELFLVVQGTSNTIWYRSYNGNWSEWVGLPGQTPSSPAAAVYGGYLQIVVRGMGDELWWGRINITTREFMGWWPMPGGGVITSAPTLTASDAELFLVVQGTSNSIWYRAYNGTWGDWIGLPGQTPDRASAAVYEGCLLIAVQGMENEDYWAKVDLQTLGFLGWRKTADKWSINAAPCLALE